MSEKTEKFTFNIQRSEYGKYSSIGITLDGVTEDTLNRYSEETIERAKVLKAKHKDKYTDAFYLDMAKIYDTRDMLGAFLKINQKNIITCAIKDPEWATYTYEEIIQMENDGYNIPKEVLKWAHSQQQADEVNYVVLSDSTQIDDNSLTDKAASPLDLDGLRTRSLSDIVKVEKAEKETETNLDLYNERAISAEKIKREKEDKYENSMNEIKNLANEWKTLDEKQKGGTKLTKEEQKRFEELGKLLNGSNGKLMKEIKLDNLQLDNYLDTLNILSDKLEKNLEISTKTIQNATQLSDYESNVENVLPFAKQSIEYNKGATNGTINGIKTDDISSVAMKKGKDFEQYTNNIKQDLEEKENINLKNFATDYTDLANETENHTKNIMGDDFEKPTDEDKKENNNQYNVDTMKFTAVNSIKATDTCIRATVDNLTNKNKTESKIKDQKENDKKSLKDFIKLNKEVASASAKHEASMSEEEKFLDELNSLQEPVEDKKQIPEGVISEESPKDDNATESNLRNNKKMQSAQPQIEILNQKQAEVQSKKLSITENLFNINSEDNTLKDGIMKSMQKSVSSTGKSEKGFNNLIKANNNLKKINDSALEASQKTAFVGAGTYAVSYLTMAASGKLLTAGAAMMAFTPTYAKGVLLTIAGIELAVQGALENVSGIGAMSAGSAGIATSMISTATHAGAKNQIKASESLIKSNKKGFEQAQKDLDLITNIPTGENVGNSKQTSAPENNSEQSQENNNRHSEQPSVQQSLAVNLNKTPETTNTQTDQPQTIQTIRTAKAVTQETPLVIQKETNDSYQQESTVRNKNQRTSNNDNNENVNENKFNETSKPETEEKSNNSAPTQDNENKGEIKQENKIKNNNNSKETDKTDNNTEENNNNNTSNEENEEPELSMEFTAQNSILAAGLAIAATSEISENQSVVEKDKKELDANIKNTNKIVQEAQTETSKAEAEHSDNAQQATIVEEKIASVQQSAKYVKKGDLAEYQNENDNLNIQYMNLSEEDTNVSQNSSIVLTNGLLQFGKFKKIADQLKSEITNLDTSITNQLKLSQHALVIGNGTSLVGADHKDTGAKMIGAGAILQMFPVTRAHGAVMLTLGAITKNKGNNEITAGAFAIAAGTDGIEANNAAKGIFGEGSGAQKSSVSQTKSIEKTLDTAASLIAVEGLASNENKKEIKDENNPEEKTENPNEHTKDEVITLKSFEIEVDTDEDGNTTDIIDESTIAGSASANARVVAIAETDDSNDRKLTRFNEESIIESRKKMKKIVAVMASSANKK